LDAWLVSRQADAREVLRRPEDFSSANALRPGAWFGLTCFRPEGGSGFTDAEVYERGSLGGGLGYTEERLRTIWSTRLDVQILRQMNKPGADSGLFGEDFLWVLLARKA